MRIQRLFTVALVVAACVALAGCDWAQIGFGPGNTATNPLEAGLTEASVAHLHVAWSTACNCSKPLVTGGTAYVVDSVPTGSVTLRAFDAASGAPRWSTVVGVNMPGISFEVDLDAVANGLAYLRVQRFGIHGDPIESGRVVAYDATTGALRWSVTPPAAGSGAARLGPDLIVDGTVAYVTTDAIPSAELSAIDTDGRVLWSRTPGGVGGALAADHGLTVYMLTDLVVTVSGRPTAVPVLAGYDEGLGEPRSTVLPDLGPVGVARIAFANGLIYGFQGYLANSGGLGLFAVDPNTGARAWSTGDNGLGPVGSRLVGPAVGAALLIARDAVSGTLTWQISTPGGPIDTAVAGGLVYFGAGTALRVVRLSDGGVDGSATPAATEKVRFVTPANGRVFVATSGHLVGLTP